MNSVFLVLLGCAVFQVDEAVVGLVAIDVVDPSAMGTWTFERQHHQRMNGCLFAIAERHSPVTLRMPAQG